MSIQGTPQQAASAHRSAGAASCGDQSDDAALILSARNGSVSAFERLVRKYQHRVVCYVQRRTGGAVDAEDVAQETFLKVWSALDRFDTTRAFKPWLFTIATREAISHARKAQRRSSLLDRFREKVAGTESDRAPIDDVLENAGAVWRIAEACLNEADLSAMWLRYAEDMSHADIAAVQECSTVRVRVALSRARQKVRDQWESLQSRANNDSSEVSP